MWKFILITLIIMAVAVFTGTWILGLLGNIFHALGNGCDFLEEIFNFFGWNKGILCIGLGGVYV